MSISKIFQSLFKGKPRNRSISTPEYAWIRLHGKAVFEAVEKR